MVEAKYILKKYLWVIVLGALMAVGLAVFFMREHTPLISSIVFTENVRGMELDLWHDTVDDVYYLFLPSYVSRKNVAWSFPDGVYVKSTPPHIGNDTTLDGLPIGEPIELAISTRGQSTEKYTIEILQSENLRTFFIETREGAMESLHKSKTSKTRATLVVIDTDGNEDWIGITTLSGRGNTTFGQAKRPYNLEFTSPTTLKCSNDSVKNWCLLANYADDSQVRNSVCNCMAKEFGIRYTSDFEFVSLYVNGEYQGLYNLATKENYIKGLGKELTSVFEVTVEERNNHNGISEKDFYFRTRYGNTEYIQNAINVFEYALYNGVPYSQLSKYIDLHSLVLKSVVDDMSGDSDPWLSQYYMLNTEGRIVPICAWDYDLSLGAANFIACDFYYNQLAEPLIWYKILFGYSEFREELYNTLVQHKEFLQNTLINYVDSLCDRMQSDWTLNEVRWRNNSPFCNGRSKIKNDSYDLSSLEGHKTYINDFLHNRFIFLERYYRNPKDFYELTFEVPNCLKKLVLCYPLKDTLSASKLPDGLINMPDKRFQGWYTLDGQSIESVGQIAHDMKFEEKISTIGEGIVHKVLKYIGLLLILFVFVCMIVLLLLKLVVKKEERI